MYINKSAINLEGGHLACLIFLPDNPVDRFFTESEIFLSDTESNKKDHMELNNGNDLRKPVETADRDGIRAMVIACHGYRGGKENGGRVISLAKKLTANNFGLIAFDFRGTGESSGKFHDITVSAQADDLQQIINWVEYTYKVPIIVLGRSLGGSTVLASVADDRRPMAVILWSTPASVRDTFGAMLGSLVDELAAGHTITITDDFSTYQLGPGFWRDLDNHDFIRYMQLAGRQPMLVIHGEADELVNVHNAMIIKSTVPSAQLITVPGADHKFINGWELRENLTVAWLVSLFS